MSENDKIYKFIEAVIEKNPLHGKTLRTSMESITEVERNKLMNLMEFYITTYHLSIDDLSVKYLKLIDIIVEEQFYFANYNKYRFSSAVEVEHYYKDQEYMSSYLIGLGLSTYLWISQRFVMSMFADFIRKIDRAKTYFEIGPGHGEYFVTAMKEADFNSYTGIDISKSSVELTNKYIRYCLSYVKMGGGVEELSS